MGLQRRAHLLGHNLVGDLSCAPISSDLVGVNPRLGSLRRDGALRLRRSSPVVDHGTNAACPATDERGAARPQDGNGDGPAICDIGAYERRRAHSNGDRESHG
jgi:hypothetical protein